jgi:hypothetical protein
MSKKKASTENIEQSDEVTESVTNVSPNSIEWTDHVLDLLSEDEKIKGNPTTDGLRRIFEIALNCTIIDSSSNVVQSPSPENEKRATVVHSLTYVLNDDTTPDETKYRSVSGAADVYWGNCDKVYRNYPVSVAETRAEGRALRRGLKLKKVVAAEEIVENTEDHPDNNTVSKITPNQINFIDVVAQRLNIDVIKLFKLHNLPQDNVYETLHEDAVNVIRILSKYQQNINDIPSDIMSYSSEWK